MLEEYRGQKIVVDLRSSFVCLGTLVDFDEIFLKIKHADLHDFRDTDTTRENYVAESKISGIKRNRRHVLIVRAEVIAISLYTDIVEQ